MASNGAEQMDRSLGEKTPDNNGGNINGGSSNSNSNSNESSSPNATCQEAQTALVEWAIDDPENPHNWSNTRKSIILSLSVLTVINSATSSSLPSMAMDQITTDLIKSASPSANTTTTSTTTTTTVLPISIYLIGYVFGPILWGPLSEHYGRRRLSLLSFAAFSLLTLGCAEAPTWTALLILRLLCGCCAGAPMAIVAGILADVYGDQKTRGRAFAVFMSMTCFGPLFGPILSGFVAPNTRLGWRWVFRIAFFGALATLFLLGWLLPETYAPVLLERRRRRRQCLHLRLGQRGAGAGAGAGAGVGDSPNVVARQDGTSLARLLTVVITRPVRMLVCELIVATSCAYIALIYAIFYMSFQAFPLVFRRRYNLSPGVTGLAYLPVGLGVMLSLAVFWAWDDIHDRAARRRHKPWAAAAAAREELRRLPLALVGGPLYVVSLVWLGLGATFSDCFVVPMLAGVPFGMGFMLIYMALINYMTDAYEDYAASANAASSCTRSILAVVLPLATEPMFARLGLDKACALLAGLSALMCPVPWLFIRYGPAIRQRSKFCLALRRQKEVQVAKRREALAATRQPC